MTTTTRLRPLTAGRAGLTLPEALIALAIAAILAALAFRGATSILDGARARSAATEVRAALALARRSAVLRGERVAVRFDSGLAAVGVHVRGDTLLSRPLGLLHGVRLQASRESTAYGGDGLGFGAANLRVVVRRGSAAETVTVSRAGRVR